MERYGWEGECVHYRSESEEEEGAHCCCRTVFSTNASKEPQRMGVKGICRLLFHSPGTVLFVFVFFFFPSGT